MTDSLQSIKRSCLHFFSGTMLSRISGMFRDISLAFFFGTNETLAALFVAFRLTHLARRLFGEGALQSAFIPHFENIRKESELKSCFFFRDLSILWTIGLTLLTLFGMFALHFIPQFLPISPGTQEVFDLMVIMLPSLIPICLFGLNIAFLQCQRKYFTAGVAPIYFNLVVIASAFLFRSQATHDGMPYLAGAMVVACIAQWFASFVPVFRLCRESLKESFFSHITLFSQEIRRLFAPLALGLLGIGASQINNTVDVIFARAADPEGPAQLWYSIRFQQLPLALFGIALSSALLPPLSRAIQANDKEKYCSFLEFSIRQVVSFLLPCMTVLLVCGMAIINAIYGRGNFSAHSVITTTSCLQGYALALLPMGIITVLAPAFYAQKNFTTPLRGAIISLFSNLVLNSFLVFVLGWKAMSVCIATSISSWMNALYLFYSLQKVVGPFISDFGWNCIKKTFLSTALASVVAWVTIIQFTSSPVFFSWGTSTYVPREFLEQMLHLVLPLGCFCLSLFFFSWICGAQDLFFFFKSKEAIKEYT